MIVPLTISSVSNKIVRCICFFFISSYFHISTSNIYNQDKKSNIALKYEEACLNELNSYFEIPTILVII